MAQDFKKRFEKNDTVFNELYFKELVGKAIIFKFLDKEILKQKSWYGGYKANIVTYTIALFSKLIDDTQKVIDFQKIWNQQGIHGDYQLDPALQEDLIEIARQVNDVIIDTPPEIRNVTEWCKKEQCWTNVQKLDIDLSPAVCNFLLSKSAADRRKNEAKLTQKIDTFIQAEVYVFNKGGEYWNSIISWNQAAKKLSPKEVSLLKVATLIPSKMPSEKQSKLIIEIERKATEEGFFVKE